jgi:hypothetical protein
LARSDAGGCALLRAWASIGFACAAGCTELASGSDTLPQEPAALEAASALPAAPDPKWGCLGKTTPARAVALRPSIPLSLNITDTTSQKVPAELSVRACNRVDVGCATPAQAPVGVAEDGQIHLSLDQGFNGFLEVTGSGTVPTLFFVSPPLETERQEAFVVVSSAGLLALASAAGLSIDPERGHLLVRAFDCQGEPSGDVEFSNDLGGEAFAFIDGLPHKGYDVTTPDGRGGFLNVPTGVVALQGREVLSGRVSGFTSVSVRKGWFTYGDLAPAP